VGAEDYLAAPTLNAFDAEAGQLLSASKPALRTSRFFRSSARLSQVTAMCSSFARWFGDAVVRARSRHSAARCRYSANTSIPTSLKAPALTLSETPSCLSA